MKHRSNFVSNSSSSSFIIKVSDISPEQLDMLLHSWGYTNRFKYVITSDIDELFGDRYGELFSPDNLPQDYLGMNVSCNQDEVIGFLLDHNVPFKCVSHGDGIYYVDNSMSSKERESYIDWYRKVRDQ